MNQSTFGAYPRALVATLAGMTLIVTGCSKKSVSDATDAGQAQAGPPSEVARPANVEHYCSLVPASLINGALGTSLTGPTAQVTNREVTCKYDSPPTVFDPKNPQASMRRQPFAYVRFYSNMSKAAWSGLKGGTRLASSMVGITPSDLAGLGDDAAVNSMQVNNIVIENDVQVFVEKARIAFQIGSMEPLAKEVVLARKIVPEL